MASILSETAVGFAASGLGLVIGFAFVVGIDFGLAALGLAIGFASIVLIPIAGGARSFIFISAPLSRGFVTVFAFDATAFPSAFNV